MNFYIAAATVALTVCGIVLAFLILRRIREEQLLTHASLETIGKFTQSGNSLAIQVNAINFTSAIELLNARIGKVSASRTRGGTAALPDVRQPSPASRFLELLQQCVKEGLRKPDAIREWENKLKSERFTASGAVSESFRKNAANILEALLHVADDEIDKLRKNTPLQDALSAMARLAGLDFIEPSEGAAFDERQHLSYKKRVDPSQEKDTIASVTRRGLMRAGSKEVLLPAYVVTYK